jgi:hypothetical protein
MSLCKRGQIYWYEFMFRRERVRESTGQSDHKAARRMEAERRTQLAQERQAREKKAVEVGCNADNLVTSRCCENLFNLDTAVITRNGKFCSKPHRERWEKDHIIVPTLREFETRFMDSVKTRSVENPPTIEFYQSKLDRLLEFNMSDDGYNLTLSEQRAQAVRDYLAMQGVPDDSMEVRGFGNSRPIASSDTARGRQENRRVEMVVSGNPIGS